MNNLPLLIGTLLQSRNQAQIYHWQRKGLGSGQAHLALQAYYEGIIPLIDELVESYQGKYGILYGYKMAGTLREDGAHAMYFEGLCMFMSSIKSTLPQDSYLLNQYDEIETLIQTTKYKLVNLQ
jgi:hypothetical protein